MTDLYPVVIIKDRYTGVYSGGLWTAFHTDEVPDGPMDSDSECAMFWEETDRDDYGIGDSPDEAYADLCGRVE